MEQIDSRRVSEIILAAPAWAKIGITMPDEILRVRAATELALTISERLTDSLTVSDRDQLALPLYSRWLHNTESATELKRLNLLGNIFAKEDCRGKSKQDILARKNAG